jgi:alpha-glucosidase
MALPGCVYLYQGEELGLPEVEDIPTTHLQDPMHFRSNGTDPGRDGCRVPMPWSGSEPPYGFNLVTTSGETWLPQPGDWSGLTVEAQSADPSSTLSLYRAALHARRHHPDLGDGPMSWLPSLDQVLSFTRGDRFACVVNLRSESIDLPTHEQVLLTSSPLKGGRLPADATAWLQLTAS